MNDKTTNWAELAEKAARAHYTNPPHIRKGNAPKVAVEPTEAQLEASEKDTLDAKATQFIRVAREELRYIPQRGKWLYWDGHIWKWDETGRAKELVKDFARSHLQRKALFGSEASKENYKWYTTLSSPSGIKDLLSLASTDAMMVASIDDFDTEVTELNTPKGSVDLRTGKLSAPTPEKLVKRSTTVAPESSPTPLYDNLLAQAFAGDPELSEYFEQMMGVSLLKSQDDQVFMYLYGAAGSGKGTLMNIAMKILGKGEAGYCTYVDSSMFTQSRQQQHPTEMMQFLGARMAISSEVSQGSKMDTGKLKKTTGGDAITGRYMGKDFVTFDATHTLWIMANDRLQVPHDDKGVWRRLRVIPFLHSRKAGEMIQGLDALIYEQEAPGILARWIEKAKQYLSEGYYTPDSVVDAGEAYVQDSDTVQAWMDECADVSDASVFTPSSPLRDSYVAWCRREKVTQIGIQEFSQALESKGYIKLRQRLSNGTGDGTGNPVRGHRGIRLSETVPVRF